MGDTTPERKANEEAAAQEASAESAHTEAVNTDAFDHDSFDPESSRPAVEQAADVVPSRTEPTNDEAIGLADEPDAPTSDFAAASSAPAVDFGAPAARQSHAPDATTPVFTSAPAEATPAWQSPAQTESHVSEPAPIDYDAAALPVVTDPVVEPVVVDAPAATPGETHPSSTAVESAAAAAVVAASVAPTAAYQPAGVAPTGQYAPTPQPIFVQAPTPPANKGNRGVGILIGLLATVAFAVLYAGGTYLVAISQNPSVEKASESFSLFVSNAVFYVPVLFFFGAFALLVAIVNRGGWWAYVLGGFAVAVIVYFSYIGGALLTVEAWQMTPSQAGQFVASQWLNPVAIIAAIAAREVPIWFGAWIAARGRKVTARNEAARREYDRVLAEGPSITRP